MAEATTFELAPIACTLTGDDYHQRLAWIAVLTCEALQSHKREGLVLELIYGPAAAERVRDMVQKEQACCGFLTFNLHENQDAMRLTITALETASAASDALFSNFLQLL